MTFVRASKAAVQVLEPESGDERRARVMVDGCVTPVARHERAYVDIPPGRHRLTLRASRNLYVQLLGSPIVDDNTIQKLFSVGAGIRGNKSFIDFAYQFSNQKEGYLPYEVEGAPNQLVTNRINQGQLLMTIGFKI